MIQAYIIRDEFSGTGPYSPPLGLLSPLLPGLRVQFKRERERDLEKRLS